MLVTLNDILPAAKRGKYAVGLFNVVTIEQAEGVFQAAEALCAPLIIGTAERFLKHCSLEMLAGMLIGRAKRSSVQVAMHFDHGCTFDGCMQALRLGFSSIMYDCSAMPYEENIRKMEEICRIARAMGVTVEGELGCVAGNEDGSTINEPRAMMTDPRLAEDFVKRTGVDALAVSVGNAHGTYRLPPKLDFDLIEEIRDSVDVPLVLHGGSGLTDGDFSRAIDCGIAKINIFTDINTAQSEACREALAAGKKSVMDFQAFAIPAIKRATEEKMRLFRSEGRC